MLPGLLPFMPYKLQPGETLPAGLKRITEEQLSTAIRQLQSPQDVHTSIYEARKSLKRARSVLRLMAPQLGPVYLEENRRLRDVARCFGPLRDAQVSLQLLDQFAGRYKRKSSLNGPRHLLLERQRHSSDQSALADSIAWLQATRKRMDDWPLLHVTTESIHAEIEKTHKQSRHAFEKAKKTRTAADFHELRKSIKRELNQKRLLASADLEELKQLASILGDHHNLAVLLDSVENASGRLKTMIRRAMKQLGAHILSSLRCPHFGDGEAWYEVAKAVFHT